MKAKLTAIGTDLVYDPDENGVPKMNMSGICVEFEIDGKRYDASIVFPLDVIRKKFEVTQSIKSKSLTNRIMKRAIDKLEKLNVKDADMTDMENVLRLKMPYLLRKAINYEKVTQIF